MSDPAMTIPSAQTMLADEIGREVDFAGVSGGIVKVRVELMERVVAALRSFPVAVAPANRGRAPTSREEIAKIVCCPDGCILADCDGKNQCIALKPEYPNLKTADVILAALPPEAIGREWQDISTAPKDGTVVDLWSACRLTDCRWESSPHHHDVPWGWTNHTLGRIVSATHWMPLPAGPSVTRPHQPGGE